MKKRYLIPTALACVLLLSASLPRLKFPTGYIPMWTKQRGGEVSALFNSRQICRIIPKIDVPAIMDHEEGNEAYLEVHFSDGKMYKVYEDFDEFVTRIRNAK